MSTSPSSSFVSLSVKSSLPMPMITPGRKRPIVVPSTSNELDSIPLFFPISKSLFVTFDEDNEANITETEKYRLDYDTISVPVIALLDETIPIPSIAIKARTRRVDRKKKISRHNVVERSLSSRISLCGFPNLPFSFNETLDCTTSKPDGEGCSVSTLTKACDDTNGNGNIRNKNTKLRSFQRGGMAACTRTINRRLSFVFKSA
eukprot:scaffold1588_cov214-Alexandrium_tamarense.AAC.14